VRRAERETRLAEVSRVNEQAFALARLHAEEFPQAARPAAEATKLDEDEIRSRHEREALKGVSILKRSARKEAHEQARHAAETEIAGRSKAGERERDLRQSELDAAWQRLVNGDPETVLTALEHAFEDNEFPAAGLDCSGEEVFLLVVLPPAEALAPARKVVETPAGNLSVKERTQTERNALYLTIMLGAVVATAKEAFAVAPGTQIATILAVRRNDGGQIAPLYLTTINRGDLEHLGPEPSELAAFFERNGGFVNIRGRTNELRPLALSAAPGLEAVMQAAASGLHAELESAGPSDEPTGSLSESVASMTHALREARRDASDLSDRKTSDLSEVPVLGESDTFILYEEARQTAMAEVDNATSPEARYEAVAIAWWICEQQLDLLRDALEEITRRDDAQQWRSTEERDRYFAYTAGWNDAAMAAGELKHSLLDELGPEVCQRILTERAEPRAEAVLREVERDRPRGSEEERIGLSERTVISASSDPLAQLTKLAMLRDSGVITQAEFEAKKAELLRRI